MADNDLLGKRVRVICPTCKEEKLIYIPSEKIDPKKGVNTISIPPNVVCTHSFQFFIDKQFKIRGYQDVDYHLDEEEINSLNEDPMWKNLDSNFNDDFDAIENSAEDIDEEEWDFEKETSETVNKGEKFKEVTSEIADMTKKGLKFLKNKIQKGTKSLKEKIEEKREEKKAKEEEILNSFYKKD